MKLEPAVKKETWYIVIGQAALLAVMLAICLLIRCFTASVVVGSLISSLLAVANFFFMGLSIQKAIDLPEEKRARAVRVSQAVRLFAVAAVVIFCAAVPKLNVIALLIPLVFPRLTIFVRGILLRRDENPDR